MLPHSVQAVRSTHQLNQDLFPDRPIIALGLEGLQNVDTDSDPDELPAAVEPESVEPESVEPAAVEPAAVSSDSDSDSSSSEEEEEIVEVVVVGRKKKRRFR